ncbi:MAG: BglG family transcription antiterminator [Clostridium sp.]
MDRKLRILEMLNESKSWIKGSDLANLLGVSPRTIRNDIKEIKEQFSNEAILTCNRQGYKLNKAQLHNRKDDTVQYFTSQNERLILIFKLLVLKEAGVDMYTLSEELYISEHTLETHIYILKKYIKNIDSKKVKLIRRGSLIVLEANSIERNSLFYDICKMIFKNIRLSDFQEVFTRVNLLDLYTIIREVTMKYYLKSRYISLRRLTIEAALLIEKEDIITRNLPTSSESDEICKEICTLIHKEFNIVLEEGKANYISNKLFSILSLQEIEKKYRVYNKEDEFSRNIKATLKEIGEVINIDLLKNEELVQKLVTHLRITIERKKIGFKSPNPLIENLKNESQFIFSLALFIMESLDISLNVNDISYIVVYLLIIIDENKQWYKSDKLLVAIVVSEGLANLEYISNQVKILDEKRQCKINKYLSSKDIEDKQVYDIIISTNNSILNYSNGVTINKEFTKIDRLKIKGTLDLAIKEKKKVAFKKTIDSLIKEELFEVNDTLTKKEEVIEHLCNTLQKKGYVNGGFYEEVIKRENLISSRIESGIALPHSYNYNSNKSGIAVLISKNGVMWGKKKVKVIMLVSLNKEDMGEFIKFSNEFNHIMLNDNICESIFNCSNVYDFKEITENFLMS